MLAVFMFHGALTYDADNDSFVDRTTGIELSLRNTFI